MNSINNLLPILRQDYPDISFEPGENFFWSPKDKIINFTSHQAVAEHGVWALLHEVAHATLGHADYDNDFELLKLESLTWQKAKLIGKKYGVDIDSEHIQDCLDTYRDWLHTRAKCSKCGVVSFQRPDGLYQCFNCKSTWRVTKSASCRKTQQVVS